MPPQLAGTRIPDLVLAAMALEGIVLVAWRRATRGGIAPRELAGALLAGLFLVLALRCALSGTPPGWMVLCLLLAGLAHLADLRRRWRPPGRGR